MGKGPETETMSSYHDSDSEGEGHTKPYGSGKVRFSLQDYYERKEMLQQKLKDKIERLENKRHKDLWTPKHCCLIKISNDMKLKPNDIFESVKRAFTEAEMTKIKGISPYLSTKNWAIQFNEEQSFHAAIKDIDIGDKQFKLIDVKQYVAENQKELPELPEYKPFTMTVHFRIHWLPIGFGKSKIRSFLANDADFIEVIDIEHEK